MIFELSSAKPILTLIKNTWSLLDINCFVVRMSVSSFIIVWASSLLSPLVSALIESSNTLNDRTKIFEMIYKKMLKFV